ncbi:MAG: hypothetical protein AAFU71_00255 [Cyanobacteria bacterium J06632_22]
MAMLPSCGANVATQCYKLQNVLIASQPSLASTTQAAEIERAEGYLALAESLSAQTVEDEILVAHQVQLVALYRQVGELLLAQTTLMEPDGRVIIRSAATDNDYRQLSQQLRETYDAIEPERNALQLYCSLQ